MRRIRTVLCVVCLLCLLGGGLMLGQAALGPGRRSPLPVAAAPARESSGVLGAAGAVPESGGVPAVEAGDFSGGQKGEEPERRHGEPSRIGWALATVGDQLVEIWRHVMEEGWADPGAGGEDGVLSEVELWGGAARLRTTYEMVDLDRLQERIADRPEASGEKLIGLSGELDVGDVGSVRIGYRLGPDAGDAGYVQVTDAQVAYRLGRRARVAAGVTWGAGTQFDHSAGVNVTYEIAPNTSLQAGYRLLSFGDGQRRGEQHNAAARLQLRF